MRRFLTFLAILIIGFTVLISTNSFGLSWEKLGILLPGKIATDISTPLDRIRIIPEESVIINAVDKVSPAVVTVSISRTRSLRSIFEVDPNDPFNIFGEQQPRTEPVEQDIGTGFIVSTDGIIVTNKHVVSVAGAKYKVIAKDDKTSDVEKIYRDPTNDLAIIKIDASNLPTVTMGDSSKLKVGQMAIAIGTALGEFRNTVTVGVISGLGRGITAGSPFEGSVERLDNVIQTDAAINPGNSGGPLLNSSGQVVGINTAVSSEGQNIGFAIPINIVKDALAEFRRTGSFQRPYLGVSYRMVTRAMAIGYEIPEGALVMDVIADTPASRAGIEAEDVIIKFDNEKVTDANGGLAKIISSKKVGDSVKLEIWRNGETKAVEVTLSEFQGE
ncbi:trypsin-like peptidase domain-containing protein [Candidatus Gottesmanbacteria bacterium]|nr:trypsin-like peptidase domain-containing protein [Candidatus Gottesmanbacteria bacterium]